jgi:hypothetical protein
VLFAASAMYGARARRLIVIEDRMIVFVCLVERIESAKSREGREMS